MNKFAYIFIFIALSALFSCGGKKAEVQESDSESEQLLQGIWIDEDDESAVFKAKGDTLYYPESGVLPVHYRIYGDTIYLDANNPTKYFVQKLTQNLFIFVNQNGETIRLVKSNSPESQKAFELEKAETVEINQTLVKRDTIVSNGTKRYHCYVQVNPTTYQVVKNEYTDEGVSVGKVYYDNIINLAVFDGANRLFSQDFHKQDFAKFVPADIMKQSILSDIVYDHCDASGVTFQAELCIPESASSYVVNIVISPQGMKSLAQPK